MDRSQFDTIEGFDVALAQTFAEFIDDPLGFVMFAFQWNEGELKGFHGPDQWQIDYLNEIGQQVRARAFNGVDPVRPLQMATASGHGIGKSALTAWLVLWIMCTRPFCKGIVTANTSPQLQTKTWAEIAKWRRRCIAGHWFNCNTAKGNMNLSRKGFEDSWRCDAQTCREENSESFAGLHAASSTPFYIFDEASAIPDKIWEVAEGGLTDGEPMWFVFGNPTRNSGRFFECFNRLRHRWITRQIDSRTARLPNKEKIAEWIADFGEDSDFVRVRVRGMFPRAGDLQFISGEVVLLAQKREARFNKTDSLVMGVDVARSGSDMSVLYFRRGLDGRSIPPIKLRLNDLMQVAAHVAQHAHGSEHTHNEVPDAINIDGGGVGAGVVDRCRQLNLDVVDVNFGSSSPDDRYSNQGSYMWVKMKNWLTYGAIPDDPQLYADLTGREYGYTDMNKLRLEKKDDMKSRGLASPDIADALSLTFAYPVVKNERSGYNVRGGGRNHQSEYEPI